MIRPVMVFICMLLALGEAVAAPPGISISFAVPSPNSTTGQDMKVAVVINSQYEISVVRASVEGRSDTLTYNTFYHWFEGTLSLDGLADGQKTLTVTARDAFGNSDSASEQITYDRIPDLTVYVPTDYSLANPFLHVHATVKDPPLNLCSIIVSGVSGVVSHTGRDLDTVLDLSAYEGRLINVTFATQDQSGLRPGGQTFLVYVTNSSNLIPVLSVPRQMLGADSLHVLYADPEGVTVRKRADTTRTVFPLPEAHPVLIADGTGPDQRRIGSLVGEGCLVTTAYGVDLRQGAAWKHWDSPDWYIREERGPYICATVYDSLGAEAIRIGPGVDSVVTIRNMSVPWIGLSKYGDVAFSRADRVYLLKNGTEKQLTTTPIGNTPRLVTDGTNTLYLRDGDSLILNDGTKELTLRRGSGPPIDLDFQFEAYDGYVAYRRLGTMGQWNIWLRDLTGTERQMTFFSKSTQLVALGPGGSMFIVEPGQSHLLYRTGQGTTVDLGFLGLRWAKCFWIAEQPYVIFQGTLFQVKTEPSAGLPQNRTVPESIILWQNYPNPFNPTTTIRYALPHRSHVTLTVFNTLGQKVVELVNGDVDAGTSEVRFDGGRLASGVYFYHLQTGTFVKTRTLVIVK